MVVTLKTDETLFFSDILNQQGQALYLKCVVSRMWADPDSMRTIKKRVKSRLQTKSGQL
jgi:hypothetical protein